MRGERSRGGQAGEGVLGGALWNTRILLNELNSEGASSFISRLTSALYSRIATFSSVPPTSRSWLCWVMDESHRSYEILADSDQKLLVQLHRASPVDQSEVVECDATAKRRARSELPMMANMEHSSADSLQGVEKTNEDSSDGPTLPPGPQSAGAPYKPPALDDPCSHSLQFQGSHSTAADGQPPQLHDHSSASGVQGPGSSLSQAFAGVEVSLRQPILQNLVSSFLPMASGVSVRTSAALPLGSLF